MKKGTPATQTSIIADLSITYHSLIFNYDGENNGFVQSNARQAALVILSRHYYELADDFERA